MQPKFSMDTRRLTITFLAAIRRRARREVHADDGGQQLGGQADREREREQEGVEHRACR